MNINNFLTIDFSHVEMALIGSIFLPVLCAVFIALFRRFNFANEFFCVLFSSSLFLVNIFLASLFVSNSKNNFTFIEIFPNIELKFHLEPLGIIFSLLASLLWFVNTLYSIGYLRGNSEQNQTRFYSYVSLSISAVMGISFAGNLFTFFLFYELLTLLTYPLVTHSGTKNAKNGGRVYLGILLGTSICFLLFGIGATYSLAGTLDFEFGGILPKTLSSSEVLFLLLIFAFGIGKAALFPFHGWLPAAMVAPTPVSALLHAVAVVKAGVFGIIKVLVYILGIEYISDTTSTDVLTFFAGFTIIYASIKALRSFNLKERLAYSTVSQLSYIVMAASLATPLAITAAVIHLISHAFGKITLFFAAGSLYTALHKTEIAELRGVGYQMPVTMICFTIGALSMIGLPPTIGVLSKWFIVSGAVQLDDYFVLVILLFSTLLNAAYFLPIIYDAFFKKPVGYDVSHQHMETTHFYHYRYFANAEAPVFILLSILSTSIGVIALVFFGDFSNYLLQYFSGEM